MKQLSNRTGRRPVVALLRALVLRHRLLPIEPSWFNRQGELKPYSLLWIQFGMWMPIKGLRLVPGDMTARVVAFAGRAKAYTNTALFLLAVGGMNAMLEPFRFFYPIQEHFMLNLLLIGLTLFLIPWLILLWKDYMALNWKSFPVPDLTESVLSAKRNINFVYAFITVFIVVFTAILSALKASAPGKAGAENALNLVEQSGQSAFEEGPGLVADVITATSQGSASIISSLGLALLRIVLGCGITLGSTFLTLKVLSPAVHSAPIFFVIFGIAASTLVAWGIYIHRKYRMPLAQTQ